MVLQVTRTNLEGKQSRRAMITHGRDSAQGSKVLQSLLSVTHRWPSEPDFSSTMRVVAVVS